MPYDNVLERHAPRGSSAPPPFSEHAGRPPLSAQVARPVDETIETRAALLSTSDGVTK